MGIREERKAATRRGIHLATLDLLEASGLEATTVAQIAKRAGISERTFFRYYDSKESAALPGQGELTEALVSRPLGRGRTSTPAQVLEELIGVCREHFAREVEQHEFLRISRLLLAESRLLQVVTRQELELVALLGGSLVQRGLLDPLRAQLAAEMIVCTWRVAWQRFAQEARAGKTSNPTEFFEEAVAALAELTPGRTGQRRR